ncbi:glycosyltransferase [Patescibacteria group bacterium]|nr:glycosyltransferase [Patescibacteria group bacterium]MBU1963966.1 glycosyltransferase [Patescibacteria group bacterium]
MQNKTIGIPAYNEGKTIKKCVCNILPQLNEEDEILIVASACTDDTVSEAESLNDARIRIIEDPVKRGKTAAINQILQEAKNKNIILSDADVIPAKNSIEQIMKHLEKDDVGAVSAKIYNYKEENFFDKLQGFGWKGLDHQKVAEHEKGTFYALNGFLLGVKKGIVGNLDEKSLVDDAILGWEVKEAGYKVIYEPEAKVYVQAAQNFSDYIKQKVRVRVGWWQMTDEGMGVTERRNAKQLKYLVTDLYAWPYITLDLIIWMKAYRDFKKKKLVWDQITSSKI